MDVCLLRQDGAGVRHRQMPARPDAVLKAIAPSRDAMVVAGACLLPWYGLAALGAQDGRPVVLGHALSLQALHGGTATNDPIDSQHLAGLLRGGLLPPASVSPAARRATRDLRRRRPLTRQRAARRAHLPQTTSPYPLAALGTPLASKAQRDGVAARCLALAVPPRGEGDLALLDHEERRHRAVALPLVQTATPPQAPPRSRRPSVPGIGPMVRLLWLAARQALARCPRRQAVVS